MIFIYGRRKARIKKFTDHIGTCSTCNSVGLDFEMHRDYFHLFWIPLFPVGIKESRVYCNTCKKPDNYNPRVKHFESVTRTPVWLYSGLFLILMLVGSLVVANINTQKEKALFVADPKVGDVYQIRKHENDTTYYYFLRVARIQSDTVIVYPNALQYFGFISKFNDEDRFIAQEYFYTKRELKELLEKGEINSVERDYGDYEGFNRIEEVEMDSLR